MLKGCAKLASSTIAWEIDFCFCMLKMLIGTNDRKVVCSKVSFLGVRDGRFDAHDAMNLACASSLFPFRVEYGFVLAFETSILNIIWSCDMYFLTGLRPTFLVCLKPLIRGNSETHDSLQIRYLPRSLVVFLR